MAAVYELIGRFVDECCTVDPKASIPGPLQKGMNLRAQRTALDDVVEALVQALADETGERIPIKRVEERFGELLERLAWNLHPSSDRRFEA